MVLRFKVFEDFHSLTHAVTTATFDGISPFNLADHVGPDRDTAVAHRRRLCRNLDLPFDKLTVCEQVHRGRVAVVEAGGVGDGAIGRASAVAGCDGLITELADVPLMTLSADCPLVLIYAPTANVFGVIHASWRALVDGIVANTVRCFAERFCCHGPELWVGVSPSAGPCCYEVGEDFPDAIAGPGRWDRFLIRDKHVTRFDLWSACRVALIESGVTPDRIEIMGYCTVCDHRFFSHRREGPDAGRFALVAAMLVG